MLTYLHTGFETGEKEKEKKRELPNFDFVGGTMKVCVCFVCAYIYDLRKEKEKETGRGGY